MSLLQTSSSYFDRKSTLALKRSISPILRRQSRRDKLSKSFLQAPSQLNQLDLSTNIIKFYYFCNGQNQHLINKDLILTNKTGKRIGFKIKCNNPQNYQVNPTQQKIQDGSSITICIRLYVQSNVNALKYNSDKFLIEWGRLDESNIPIYSAKTSLTVSMITDNSQMRNEQMIKTMSLSQKEINIYLQLIKKNKSKIAKLEEELEQVENQPKSWSLSKSMTVVLGTLAFAAGYLIY